MNHAGLSPEDPRETKKSIKLSSTHSSHQWEDRVCKANVSKSRNANHGVEAKAKVKVEVEVGEDGTALFSNAVGGWTTPGQGSSEA